MTPKADWQFWTIVTLLSIAFLCAFVSLGDDGTVVAGEVEATDGAGFAQAPLSAGTQ